MSIVDELMKIDAGLVKKNEADLKMKLSRIGKEYTFHCIEIDQEEATKLAEEGLNINANGDISVSTFKTRIQTILLGCPSVFQNAELQAHFGCITSLDLIKKLLTKDEIEKLSDFINELGSLDKVDTNEIKN